MTEYESQLAQAISAYLSARSSLHEAQRKFYAAQKSVETLLDLGRYCEASEHERVLLTPDTSNGYYLITIDESCESFTVTRAADHFAMATTCEGSRSVFGQMTRQCCPQRETCLRHTSNIDPEGNVTNEWDAISFSSDYSTPCISYIKDNSVTDNPAYDTCT